MLRLVVDNYIYAAPEARVSVSPLPPATLPLGRAPEGRRLRSVGSGQRSPLGGLPSIGVSGCRNGGKVARQVGGRANAPVARAATRTRSLTVVPGGDVA